jgi:hypothetical protein
MTISIAIAPYVTQVNVSSSGDTEIDISPVVTTVVEAALAIPLQVASHVYITPIGTITALTVQGALEQLASQDFRSSTTPTGSNIEEGDTWYNTATETLSVYRETSPEFFEWVPIMIGNISPDSDTLDAGAF